jgi:hypothetical protein
MKNQEILQADTRKSTHLLKKHLKSIFGIDFKVRSEFFSMGCSLNISYTLGPDNKEVENITENLRYGRFDGMQDLAYSVDVAGIIVDGYQLQEFKFVHVKQEISKALKFKMTKLISDFMSFEGSFPLENEEQMHESFKERFGAAWTWSDIFYQRVQTHNFVTQDENKINIISVHVSEKGVNQLYFIYEVDGIKYSTEEWIYSSKEKSSKKEKEEFEKAEVKAGEIQIIDYSERAIAVIGDTKPIKDKLGKDGLGGKFNMRLSCGPGWIFPKKRLEEIQKALSA